MLPFLLLLNAPAQVKYVNPRPVYISVFVHKTTVMWRAQNAYECFIEGLDNPYRSGDIPYRGALDLPAGKYRITATGDRGRTAVANFEIKE